MFKGKANAQACSEYLEKSGIKKNHQNEFCGLPVSGLAMGSYIGGVDEITDRKMTQATLKAMELGCNVLDCAINYRRQHSEKSIGEALRQAILNKKIKREEVFVCTKGGFVPFETATDRDLPKLFDEQYVSKGLAKKSELIAGCHCMEPAYIQNQIEKSRQNLGLETIDLYYLHNPEMQLEELPPRIFYEKLSIAFEVLETAVKENQIAHYGLATWNAFRDEASSSSSVQLEKCVELAEKAAQKLGFSKSHFAAIQLPLNLGMPEAGLLRTQKIGNTMLTALQAAAALDLSVATSVPLLQGKLCHSLPEFVIEKFPESYSQAHCAISFAKSFDAVNVVIVGMKELDHVEHNLSFFKQPLLTEADRVNVLSVIVEEK